MICPKCNLPGAKVAKDKLTHKACGMEATRIIPGSMAEKMWPDKKWFVIEFAKPGARQAMGDHLRDAAEKNAETPCPAREDKQHCNCWYDGKTCCACGDPAMEGECLTPEN